MAEEPSTASELSAHTTILVGVDGSVTSLRAGAYAAGLARRQRARLVCLYVEQHSALYGTAAAAGAGVTAGEDEALTEIGEDLRRQAGVWAGRLDISITFITAQGDPYTELCQVADEIRADAMVVGASTKAGHRWVGSLAIRMVKAGRWPVMVVP